MDASEHIRHIHEEYQAFCDGDFDAVGRLLADEAVWHVGGKRVESGDKQGRDEIVSFLRRLSESTHENFRIQAHDVLANDEHVVALCHVTSEVGDTTYRADEVHIFHLDENGKIDEAWGFTNEPGGQGVFWF